MLRSFDSARPPASIRKRCASGRRPITLASTVTRDVVARVGADTGLEQIAEHIDAGPQLGDAGERARVQHGGRAADRDDRAGMPGGAQALGRAHRAGALRLGNARHVGVVAAGIAVPGMGHHARQTRPQPGGEFQQRRVVGCETAAVLAGVDLDQRARCRGVCRDRGGGVEIVGDDRDIRTRGVQPCDRIQLLRRDADRVEDVA